MSDSRTTTEECLALAQAELKVAQQMLAKEISSYPTPITLCDCEFNFMLGQRQKIAAALAILETETTELIQKAH